MIAKIYHYITSDTDPFHNLALEEWLLRRVGADECIMYLWQNKRTVVIGRNQNPWSECLVSQLESEGGQLARRLSGGGAVYHDLGNLNFTFLVQAENYDVLRQSEVILHALRVFGIEAKLSGRNDIEVEGKKCSGSAYYRSGRQCYHHGTLLVELDIEDMSKYLCVDPSKLSSKGVSSVRSRVVNLQRISPELTVEKLKRQLAESFAEVYGLSSETFWLGDADFSESQDFFASEGWRFGASPSLSAEIKERFSWGDLRLCFELEQGKVSDIQVFSDGMEAEFLASLPKLIRGCSYELSALKMRLTGVSLRSEAEAQILSDCSQLFDRLFERQMKEDLHV